MSIFSSNKDTRDTPAAPAYVPPAPAPNPVASHATPSSSNYTNIADGTTIDGQIKIEGDVKIEGIVKGTVTSKGRVIISTSGKVDGDIICQNADISGHVTGKLKIADILILKGNAVVDGDINTGKLMMENGVKFNGNCSMGAPVPQPAAAPQPAPKPVNTVQTSA